MQSLSHTRHYLSRYHLTSVVFNLLRLSNTDLPPPLDLHCELIPQLRPPVPTLDHRLHLTRRDDYSIAGYDRRLRLLDVDEIDATAAVIDEDSAVTARQGVQSCRTDAHVVRHAADVDVGHAAFLKLGG